MEMPAAAPPAKTGVITKFLLRIAGVDEPTLRLCPQHDWDNVRAVAEIMIFTWFYQTALFSLIGHCLFAPSGQIRPAIIAGAMFIAGFILLLDSYLVMRSGWHLSGIQELKRGGIDISGGLGARIKAGFFLCVRILLSIGLAQLTAIFVSLLIFGGDISARIEDAYLRANAHLVPAATALVDGQIQRATEAVKAETAREAALAAQVTTLRQDQVDPSASDPQMQIAQQELARLIDQNAKAEQDVSAAEKFLADEEGGIRGAKGNSGVPGMGPRYRAALVEEANAKRHAKEIADALSAARQRVDALDRQLSVTTGALEKQARGQLPTYQDALAQEDKKLSAMRKHLADLIQGRDDAIRAAVEHAPDYVARNDGFLTQITMLEQIARSDNKIAAVILLIDLVSFGFELAAVLAKVTSYVPTTYATLLARDAYLRVVRLVEEMMKELSTGDEIAEEVPLDLPHDLPIDEPRLNGEAAFGSTSVFEVGDAPEPKPKRARGRPRKVLVH